MLIWAENAHSTSLPHPNWKPFFSYAKECLMCSIVRCTLNDGIIINVKVAVRASISLAPLTISIWSLVHTFSFSFFSSWSFVLHYRFWETTTGHIVLSLHRTCRTIKSILTFILWQSCHTVQKKKYHQWSKEGTGTETEHIQCQHMLQIRTLWCMISLTGTVYLAVNNTIFYPLPYKEKRKSFWHYFSYFFVTFQLLLFLKNLWVKKKYFGIFIRGHDLGTDFHFYKLNEV